MSTKVCLVKHMVFPVVMYRCGSWTIKEVEYQRIDVFKLWCWRRLFGVPSTARKSNQSILKEISPEYSLEGLMLKVQFFCHLMWKANSLEKTDGGKDWGQEKGTTADEMVGWRHRLDGDEFEQVPGDSEGQGSLACCGPWGHKELAKTEQLNKNKYMMWYWVNKYIVCKEVKASHCQMKEGRL